MEEETRQVLIEFKNDIVGDIRAFKTGMTEEFRAFKTRMTKEFRAFKTGVTGEIRSLSGKVETLDQRVESLDQKIDRVKEEVTEEMKRHVGIVYENFQDKLDLVVEGHQMLNEQLARLREENHREHEEFQMTYLKLGGRIRSLEQQNP